jgi:ribonuclease HI
MAKKQKYYVVWEGNTPGIYDSWEKCQLQIKAYPNAKYKAFPTKEEAIQAFEGNYYDFITKGEKKTIKSPKLLEKANIIWDSIAVDAACSGNPGNLEYRGVFTNSGKEIFKEGVFKKGTNNIGEFLALVHALALLQKKQQFTTPIYSDSRTAMAWVRNKKVKTNLTRSQENKLLFELLERALLWLDTNSFKNPILKWDTKNWGEIPADFGRK